MNLRYSKVHVQFQRELENFLKKQWDRKRSTDAEYVTSFRALATGEGYLYRGVPKRYGGSEQPVDVVKAQIISEAFTRAKAPMEVPGNGITMLTPVLLECGSEWQKETFIPKTVTGEYKWAQGYSEPGAGSDLASLRTRAELVGDEWIINGHKIWTTKALEANYMFALVRTEPDAPKHAGLSYMLMDFKQPGIEVRPIRQITGEQNFCEVFLNDVKTPVDWIVGKRGEGWNVSKVNLKHERNAVGSASRSTDLFESLLRIARTSMIDGKAAIEDPMIRQRIVEIDGFVKAQIYAGYYQATMIAKNESPGVLALCNKLNNTNIGKMIADVAIDILGDTLLEMPAASGKTGSERWVRQVLGSLGMTIAGGTSNIQKNIISERGLGLPRHEQIG